MGKAIFLVLLCIGVPSAALATDLVDYVTLNTEYLIDDDDYKYGLNYYASSSYSNYVCEYNRVTIRENVTGSVQPGPVLLDPHESRFLIGSFRAANYGEAWSVNVQYSANDDCY